MKRSMEMTMHSMYKKNGGHKICIKCGYCIECGDCDEFGCGKHIKKKKSKKS